MFILNPYSPARFHDARQLAARSSLSEADAAHAELPQERAWASAQKAAMVPLRLELRRSLALFDHAFLGH
jgi:hypothetical protein